jgi:hypothetical protein
MDLRAGLDRCGKSRPPPGFDPGTVQHVGSRYTHYATRPTANQRKADVLSLYIYFLLLFTGTLFNRFFSKLTFIIM